MRRLLAVSKVLSCRPARGSEGVQDRGAVVSPCAPLAGTDRRQRGCCYSCAAWRLFGARLCVSRARSGLLQEGVCLLDGPVGLEKSFFLRLLRRSRVGTRDSRVSPQLRARERRAFAPADR